MNKRIIGGGKTFLDWWKNPRNRNKVYDSDKSDAEFFKKLKENNKESRQ